MSVGSIRIYLKIPEAFAFRQGKNCSSGNLEQNAFMQTTSVNDFQILHAKWFLNEVIKTNWNLNGEISYYHIQFKRICARYAVNGVWAYFDAGMWMRVRVLVWRRHVIMKWRRKQESHFFNFRHHDYFTSVFILFHRFFFFCTSCKYKVEANRFMLECYASICMARVLTAGDVLCSAMSTIFFILFKLPKGWLDAKSLLRSSSNLSSLEINILCHHQYLHEKSLFSLSFSISLQRKENRIIQQNIAGKMNEEGKKLCYLWRKLQIGLVFIWVLVLRQDFIRFFHY